MKTQPLQYIYMLFGTFLRYEFDYDIYVRLTHIPLGTQEAFTL